MTVLKDGLIGGMNLHTNQLFLILNNLLVHIHKSISYLNTRIHTGFFASLNKAVNAFNQSIVNQLVSLLVIGIKNT